MYEEGGAMRGRVTHSPSSVSVQSPSPSAHAFHQQQPTSPLTLLNARPPASMPPMELILQRLTNLESLFANISSSSSHSGCAPLSAILNHGDQINKLVAGLDFLEEHLIRSDSVLEALQEQITAVVKGEKHGHASASSTKALTSKVHSMDELLERLRAHMATLDKRATSAVTGLQAMQSRVGDGESGLQGAVERLASSEAVLQGLKGKVKGADTKLQAVLGKVGTTEAGLQAIQGRLNGNELGLELLQGRLGVAEGGLQQLHTRMGASEGGLLQLQGSIRSCEGGLQQALGRLGGAEGRLGELQSGLVEVNERLGDLALYVDGLAVKLLDQDTGEEGTGSQSNHEQQEEEDYAEASRLDSLAADLLQLRSDFAALAQQQHSPSKPGAAPAPPPAAPAPQSISHAEAEELRAQIALLAAQLQPVKAEAAESSKRAAAAEARAAAVEAAVAAAAAAAAAPLGPEPTSPLAAAPAPSPAAAAAAAGTVPAGPSSTKQAPGSGLAAAAAAAAGKPHYAEVEAATRAEVASRVAAAEVSALEAQAVAARVEQRLEAAEARVQEAWALASRAEARAATAGCLGEPLQAAAAAAVLQTPEAHDAGAGGPGTRAGLGVELAGVGEGSAAREVPVADQSLGSADQSLGSASSGLHTQHTAAEVAGLVREVAELRAGLLGAASAADGAAGVQHVLLLCTALAAAHAARGGFAVTQALPSVEGKAADAHGAEGPETHLMRRMMEEVQAGQAQLTREVEALASDVEACSSRVARLSRDVVEATAESGQCRVRLSRVAADVEGCMQGNADVGVRLSELDGANQTLRSFHESHTAQVQLQLDDVASAQEALTAQLRAQDEHAEQLWGQLRAQVHAHLQQVEQRMQQVQSAQAQQQELQQQQKELQQQQGLHPASSPGAGTGAARSCVLTAATAAGHEGGHITLKQQVEGLSQRLATLEAQLPDALADRLPEVVGTQVPGLVAARLPALVEAHLPSLVVAQVGPVAAKLNSAAQRTLEEVRKGAQAAREEVLGKGGLAERFAALESLVDGLQQARLIHSQDASAPSGCPGGLVEGGHCVGAAGQSVDAAGLESEEGAGKQSDYDDASSGDAAAALEDASRGGVEARVVALEQHLAQLSDQVQAQLRQLSDSAAKREELTALKQALVTFDMASRLQAQQQRTSTAPPSPTHTARTGAAQSCAGALLLTPVSSASKQQQQGPQGLTDADSGQGGLHEQQQQQQQQSLRPGQLRYGAEAAAARELEARITALEKQLHALHAEARGGGAAGAHGHSLQQGAVAPPSAHAVGGEGSSPALGGGAEGDGGNSASMTDLAARQAAMEQRVADYGKVLQAMRNRIVALQEYVDSSQGSVKTLHEVHSSVMLRLCALEAAHAS